MHHTLADLEATKFKRDQQQGMEPGWTFFPMVGTTFGAIGEQAVKCLELLPELARRESTEKSSVNAMVLING